MLMFPPCSVLVASALAVALITEFVPTLTSGDLISIFPAFPLLLVSTASLLKLSRLNLPVASTIILPPSPFPFVLASITAPLVTSREPAVIFISPASPTAFGVTRLNAALDRLFVLPSNTTLSSAVIFTLPAFPFPWVLAFITAPLVTSREPVSIVISPAFPVPCGATRLDTLLR